MIATKRAALSPNKVQYLFDRPEYGTITPVQDGLFWLRQPLPFALDHINIWLVDDGDSWTIIDCGYCNQASLDIWENVLSSFLAGKPVHRLIATHYHPDHVGLLGWLVERLGAGALMSRTEWLTARMLTLDESEMFAAVGEQQDQRAGLDAETVAMRRKRGNMYRRGVTMPPSPIGLLKHGDTITMAGSIWQVRVGEGHAPELLTFYCEERSLLISADHILPRISPIIGVSASTPHADPLSDFQRTLPPFKSLPEDTVVLPSHDSPFRGLHGRIDHLLAHHDERLAQTFEACREPRSAAEIIPVLFNRQLDVHQIGFALAETLAHINHLVAKGEIHVDIDAAGVCRYRANEA